MGPATIKFASSRTPDRSLRPPAAASSREEMVLSRLTSRAWDGRWNIASAPDQSRDCHRLRRSALKRRLTRRGGHVHRPAPAPRADRAHPAAGASHMVRFASSRTYVVCGTPWSSTKAGANSAPAWTTACRPRRASRARPPRRPRPGESGSTPGVTLRRLSAAVLGDHLPPALGLGAGAGETTLRGSLARSPAAGITPSQLAWPQRWADTAQFAGGAAGVSN